MERLENIETEAEYTQGAAVETEETEKVGSVPESDTKKTGYTHSFAKPFVYEDKKYKELNFDFEKLKGKDMIVIENEMAAVGEYALSPEISTSFLSKMAARAAGVGSDVIENLPLRDFGKIKNESRNFLISTGF